MATVKLSKSMPAKKKPLPAKRSPHKNSAVASALKSVVLATELLADPANQPQKDAVAPLIPNPRLAKEKWQLAAAKARATGKMANTLAKALAQRHAKRWRFVDFRGMGGQESRGIVDILAVRKDAKTEHMRLKTYDLFEMALIQVKGGAAPMPTLEDLGRLRTVAERYGATQIVLFQWTKGVSSGFYELATDNRWLEKSAKQLFG